MAKGKRQLRTEEGWHASQRQTSRARRVGAGRTTGVHGESRTADLEGRGREAHASAGTLLLENRGSFSKLCTDMSTRNPGKRFQESRTGLILQSFHIAPVDSFLEQSNRPACLGRKLSVSFLSSSAAPALIFSCPSHEPSQPHSGAEKSFLRLAGEETRA